MKTSHIIGLLVVTGVVVYVVRKKTKSAPPAQSTDASILHGAVEDVKGWWAGFSGGKPPGVGAMDDFASIPHGTTATELDGINGNWSDAAPASAPTGPQNYSDLAIGGIAPYDINSLYA